MEPWKVLLLVAALVIAIAFGLSYKNKSTLDEAKKECEKLNGSIARTKGEADKIKAEGEEIAKETESLKKETVSLKNQLATTQAQVSELDLRIKTLNEDIAKATKEIASYEGLRKTVGEVDQFEAKLAAVKTEVTDLEEVVTTTKNLKAVNEAKKDESERSIKVKEAMDTFRRTGQNWAPVASKITAAFNDWGFVVIGAGDDQNISNAAILDVTRDGKPVCKLIVTEVQLKQAIADIVPNSLVPGQKVQIGDRVSKPAAVSLPN